MRMPSTATTIPPISCHCLVYNIISRIAVRWGPTQAIRPLPAMGALCWSSSSWSSACSSILSQYGILSLASSSPAADFLDDLLGCMDPRQVCPLNSARMIRLSMLSAKENLAPDWLPKHFEPTRDSWPHGRVRTQCPLVLMPAGDDSVA